MPRHKTGGAVLRLVKKGKKTKKIWYARIQFFDDFGKRKQRHRKPDYNSETSARAKAREMLAELDENPKSFDAPEAGNFARHKPRSGNSTQSCRGVTDGWLSCR